MKFKRKIKPMVIAIVVLLFADKCLCRQTIFLPNARMYVKMVKLGDGSKKLYFSLRLLPLMFNSDNIQQFQELISLCKNYGCEIIVVSTPISDRMLWKSKVLDTFKNHL